MKRMFLKSICSAAFLLAGSATIAMTTGIADEAIVFKVTSKIYDNGTLVASPQLVALENQKAMIYISDNIKTKDNKINITGNSLKLAMVARDVMRGSKEAIGVNYDIHYKNGKEKMHSKNQIIVMPKQEGVIRFSSKSGHKYELHVVAEKQIL